MITSPVEARLRTHVTMLAGNIGERHVLRPEALAAASNYIIAEWREQGYVPERERFVVDGYKCANLIATRPGRALADEILLIGAHYDTVRGSPGADDNASGVAGLARAVACLCRARARAHGPLRRLYQRGAAILLYRAHGQRRSRQGGPGARRADRCSWSRSRCWATTTTGPGSQRYPPLFRWFYPDRGDFLGFVGDLRSRGIMRASGRRISRRQRAAARDLRHLPLDPGCRLERPRAVLAAGLPRLHGHRHGLSSKSLLPHRWGRAPDPRLRPVCCGSGRPGCVLHAAFGKQGSGARRVTVTSACTPARAKLRSLGRRCATPLLDLLILP